MQRLNIRPELRIRPELQVAAPIPAAEVPGGQLLELSITVIAPCGNARGRVHLHDEVVLEGLFRSVVRNGPSRQFPAGTNGRSISVGSGNVGSAIPVIADFATLTDIVPVDRP